MKSKTLKPLQGSIRGYLYDFTVGNDTINKNQEIVKQSFINLTKV